MNDIGREGADHAAEYLGAIKGTWPLLLLAGGVAFASAVYQLKRGYKQRTAAQKCVTVLLNTVLTASLAMGGAFLLPLFMPEATAFAVSRSNGVPLSMESTSLSYALSGRYLNIFSRLNTSSP